jgi:hypothetical protein|tara:strand:- start:379 stop:1002 length:624 start_codon:yes stop_codon:yes gene_type:complete
LDTFKNFLGLALLIASIFVFGLKGMSVEMGIAVAGSCVFLAFANLDQFAEFKGAGFEAKLKQAVTEANATIENLKSVAAPLLITTIDLLAKEGRWGGGGKTNNRDALFDKLVSLQDEIGISDQDLEIAKAQYLNIHAWDKVSDLVSSVERSGRERFSVEVKDQLGSHSYDAPPDLERLLKLIDEDSLSPSELEKLNEIKEFYRRNKL